MTKNPRRVLDAVCGICTLAPLLWYIALCIYSLFLPDNESKDYVFLFLFIAVLPVLIFKAVRTGELFILKKPILTGTTLIILGMLLFVFGTSMLGLGSNLLIKLPFLLLAAAGVLSIINAAKVSAGKESQNENNDFTGDD